MEKDAIDKVLIEYFNDVQSTFYLMLNHDIHYYTVFFNPSLEQYLVAVNVYDIIKELGDIVDIEYNKDNKMLETWIRDEEGNVRMYGLFDYQKGVVVV